MLIYGILIRKERRRLGTEGVVGGLFMNLDPKREARSRLQEGCGASRTSDSTSSLKIRSTGQSDERLGSVMGITSGLLFSTRRVQVKSQIKKGNPLLWGEGPRHA